MKLDNTYFYVYYLSMRFCKKIKPKDIDNASTALFVLSVPFVLNIFSVFTYFEKSLLTKSNTYLISILIAVPMFAINYFILYKKSLEITSYYDEKYKDRPYNKTGILLLILYVIFSFAICGYLAYLKRNHRI